MNFANKGELLEVLHNWSTLTEVIADLNKQDIVTLLQHEQANKRRETFLKRLSQRLNKINYDAAVESTDKVLDND